MADARGENVKYSWRRKILSSTGLRRMSVPGSVLSLLLYRPPLAFRLHHSGFGVSVVFLCSSALAVSSTEAS
jgi:hypothetical protein